MVHKNEFKASRISLINIFLFNSDYIIKLVRDFVKGICSTKSKKRSLQKIHKVRNLANYENGKGITFI